MDEPVPQRTGEITAVGEPVSNAETFTVDQTGATIASSDGSITLHFPAGAVSSATTVSIQKLVSTTPNGVGDAYRLGPHGEFAAPVTIVMKYPLDSISVQDGLGIAYQDETGVWNAVKIVEHDKQAQTISVQTTHFSDWSLFESVKISPAFSVVAPNDKVELKVTAVLKDEELLTPLTDVSTPLGSTALDPEYIGMWILAGPGALTPAGSTAQYKAAADYGSTATVTVGLNLRGAPGTIGKAKIIIGGSYVTFAGGPYGTETVHGYANALYIAKSNITLITFNAKTKDAEYSVVITYPGSGPGTQAWVMTNDKECHVISLQKYVGASVSGTFADPDVEKSHHDGSITIDSYQPVGKYITGSFQGGFTYFPNACDGCIMKGSISGTFFAKRHM